MDNPTTILTMVDGRTTMPVVPYSGETRDQIILIREAIHALRTEAASQINVKVQREKWSLTVEARK